MRPNQPPHRPVPSLFILLRHVLSRFAHRPRVRHARWAAGFFLAAAAAHAAAPLQLAVDIDGVRFPVSHVDHRPFYVAEGRAAPVPADATWVVEGDVAANAGAIHWSPAHSVSRRDLPDRERATAAKTHVGQVSLSHVREKFGAKEESEFLRLWPAPPTSEILVVFGWVLERRIVAAKAIRVRAGAKYFEVSHKFDLTAAESGGQPIALLWAEGRFLAPTARYATRAEQSAFLAIVLADHAALAAALKAGVKPLAADARKASLLHFAAEMGNLPAVEALLAAGAKPNSTSLKLTTPLQWAAGNGRLAVVERLLAAGARVNADQDGTPPLHLAVERRHTEVALRLLAAKARTEHRNPLNKGAVSIAVDAGEAEVLAAMLASGATYMFENEQTARVLITQAEAGHTSMVRLLAAKGVPVDVEFRGMSALLQGAKCGDPALAEFLLERGAKVNRATSKGFTAAMAAALFGQADYLAVLLRHGADSSARTPAGHTALHCAALSRSSAAARVLLDHGASLEARDQNGFNALAFAIDQHARELAAELARRGGRVELQHPSAAHVLLQAVVLDLAAVVQRALDDGWDAVRPLQDGWALADVAAAVNAQSCAALLHERGARPQPRPIAALNTLDPPLRVTRAVMPDDPRELDDDLPAENISASIVVDHEGRALFPRITSEPNRVLDGPTLAAIRHWRFAPPRQGGQPVLVRVEIPVVYPATRDIVVEAFQADTLPVVVEQTRPVYPLSLRRSELGGEVRLRFVVNEEGRTERIRVKFSAHPELDEAAVKALAQWRFKPALLEGKPVKTWIELPVIFAIQ